MTFKQYALKNILITTLLSLSLYLCQFLITPENKIIDEKNTTSSQEALPKGTITKSESFDLKRIEERLKEGFTYKQKSSDAYLKNLQISIHQFAKNELRYAPYLPVETIEHHIKEIFDFQQLKINISIRSTIPDDMIVAPESLVNGTIIRHNDYTISKTSQGKYLLIMVNGSYAEKTEKTIPQDIINQLHVLETKQAASFNQPIANNQINQTETIKQTIVIQKIDIIYYIILVLWIFLVINISIYYAMLQRRQNMRHEFLNNEKQDNEKELESNDECYALMKQYKNTLMELNESQEQLKKLTDFHNEFIADAAHQLSTPLTSIYMNLDLIEMSDDPEHIKSCLSHIKASTDMLNMHSKELIYLSTQVDIVHIESLINISQLTLNKTMFYSHIASEVKKKVTSFIEPNIHLTMNQMEFEHLIDNNLTNALKYSYANANLTIVLKRVNPTEVHLIFESEGKEIKDKNAIFERHYRENTRERGYGLGLAITKKICDKYNIKINVAYNLNKNIFTYVLSGTSL